MQLFLDGRAVLAKVFIGEVPDDCYVIRASYLDTEEKLGEDELLKLEFENDSWIYQEWKKTPSHLKRDGRII